MAPRLLLGQVANANPPVNAAGSLYLLGTTYGNSVGTDVPLLVESQDVAPMGPSGYALFRRVEVPVVYTAACTVQITPIVDFLQQATVTPSAYPSPVQRTTDFADGVLAQGGTTCRARLEVTSRQGPVELAAPVIGFQPKATTTAFPVGNNP